MTFGTFPVALQNAIQAGFLERAFVDPLINKLAYRKIADKEIFPGRIGDTITKTRVGLMVPNITPLDPSTNTNLDNGLTPQPYYDEQYTLKIQQVPQSTYKINLLDDEITIASNAIRNAENLGIAQATSIDRIAKGALFNSYMGGNTVCSVTLSAPGTVMFVDDLRGFQQVMVNGNMVPVSPTNPLPIFIRGVAHNVVGFTIQPINVSSAASSGGYSGSITTAAPIAVVDGTVRNQVVSRFAPLILRPNGKQTTQNLVSSDLLNMTTILNAVAYMRNNSIPTCDGHYNLYLNSNSMYQLYQDPEFQILNRGVSTRDPVYANAQIYDSFLDVRFILTTETTVQENQGLTPTTQNPVPVGVTVQRPILCGQGALIEGIFSKGLDAVKNMGGQGGVGSMEEFGMMVSNEDFSSEGCYQYLRKPIDSLGQIITQTSSYIGGFAVPTDATTNPTIIPTSSYAYYKRCVILETA